MAVSLIPQHFLEENALISAEYFEKDYGEPLTNGYEDERYYWNATDLLIIEESYNLKDFSASLLNPYYNSSEHGFLESFSIMLNNNLEGNVFYLRYWQGFRIFIRPLLIFFSFQDIRKLFAVVFFLLFSCMTAVIAKKQSIQNAVAVAAAVCLFNPAVVSHSLQYAPCFIMMFAFSIYVVVNDIRPGRLGPLFALFGMITQYFDFYTAPIITCAVPALLVMTKEPEDRNLWKTLVICCLSWLFGYVAIWLVKLLLAWVFTPINGFQNGFSSLADRLSGNEQSKTASILYALQYVWFLSSPGRLPKETLLVLCGVIAVSIAAAYVKDGRTWSALLHRVPFLAVAALPVLWVAVASDPTIIHAYYEYRLMLPFYAGSFLFICQCFAGKKDPSAHPCDG